MKHLKKAFCLLLAAVMLLALGVPVMAAGEIPVDAEHFPDAALRTYVTDYCDTNKDNKLSAAECAAVQCIDLFEMQITKVADMTGIEHFTNLRELLACNNQITTLDLSGMTKLEKLDVSGCGKLQSLKLAGCTALTSLDASSCALTALDLTGCTALKTVACSYNDLTALDVSKNTHLSEIYCGGNQLATLDLTGLPIKDAETDTGHVQTLPGSYALTGTENGVGLFDLSQIVGKDNIGSITAVKGASYDKEAGIARYSAAVEKPSYTYATGSSAVSLTVSFSLDMSTMPKSPFTDVVAGSWYFDAALYASSHNLMLGTSPTEFSPNITMTRGMLVTVLYRMNGSPSVSGKTPFTDVRTDEWYSAAVLWAYQNGIVTGMSDTTFAPINNVTREQMATILFRYTKTAAPDKAKASADLSGFADAGSVNDWAVDAMRWAVGQKLIAGITLEQSVYLQPRGNATRAQAATVLTRYYAQ